MVHNFFVRGGNKTAKTDDAMECHNVNKDK